MLQHFECVNYTTENGDELKNITIAYHVYGNFDPRKKVIWICHALTANSDAKDWWSGMVGDDLWIDPKKYTVICANILGSCYGTYFESEKKRPLLTIRDLVAQHISLANHLNINSIDLLMGGSLGGMQCLEWAIMEPKRIQQLTVIATNAKHSPWGIAFNETQRMALDLGENGLDTARAIAMLSYRNYKTYLKTQEDTEPKTDGYLASSYQRYQGEKLRKRFDVDSYFILSKTMDTNNLGRKRESIEAALRSIQAKTLVVSIQSDILFPPMEQAYIAQHIPKAHYEMIDSLYGHDGFLLETKAYGNLIKKYLILD